MPASTCAHCGRPIAPDAPCGCRPASTTTLHGAPRPRVPGPRVGVTQTNLRRAEPAAAPPPLEPSPVPVGQTGEFARGQAIGPYVIEDLLGDGPHTAVYSATDPRRKRRVTLKIAHADQHLTDRLRYELALLRSFSHSGIVRPLEIGDLKGRAYLVREHLQGRSLQQILDDQRAGALRGFHHAELLSIWRQLAEALAMLHQRQPLVLHRNLLPAHVMLVRPVRAVIIGFGLADSIDHLREDPRGWSAGTPAYMSPEQLDGCRLDERSDIFQLGLLMHEMVLRTCLGGKGAAPPWFENREHWAAPTFRRWDRAFPKPMEEAVLRCLELDPLRRCRHTAELLRDLCQSALEPVLQVGQLPAQRITDELDRGPSRAPAPPVTSARPPPAVLACLPDYEIESRIDSTSGEEAYLARHRDLNRQFVIRMPPVPPDPAARALLDRRIDELSGLSDPRIVRLLEVGRAGEHVVLVFEHIPSETLPRPLTVAESLTIFEDLLHALAACHARRVLHRALRSSSVLIEPDGHARLTGFCLAPRRARGTNYATDDRALLDAGSMPPEEFEGDEPDARSDLYRCGVVLYEMLTGRHPIGGASLDMVYEAIAKKVPAPVSMFNPACSAPLVTLVQNLLEKRSRIRYQSAADVLSDLALVRAGEAVRRRKHLP